MTARRTPEEVEFLHDVTADLKRFVPYIELQVRVVQRSIGTGLSFHGVIYGLCFHQVKRVARGLRADEKIDTPVTRLLGKHDVVTNLYRDRDQWRPYTTREVSRQGKGLKESVKGQGPEGEDGKAACWTLFSRLALDIRVAVMMCSR